MRTVVFGLRSLSPIAFAAVLAFSSTSAGSGVDAKTRDLLIVKLTQVHVNLAPQDPSRPGVALRLADLLSERARVKALAELESAGEARSAAASLDRREALELYLGVVDKLPADQKGKVQSQVGHLYELIGEEDRAIAAYNAILAGQPTPASSAEANLSLGEVYFKRRDYARSEKHYQAVINAPQAASRGLAAYRRAWCRFNQGDLAAAIDGLMTVLRTPELLTRTGSAGVVSVDKQFAEEVSRDLATFFARRPVTAVDVETLFKLSPEAAGIPNLTYLASELERLGQAAASVDVWRFVEQRQDKPVPRLESQIRLAQLEMDLGRRADALKDFNAALNLWATMGSCQDAACGELKSRLRKFILDWNRVEKKNPPVELLATYEAYLKTFPAEIDMRLWAAQAASGAREYDRAMAHYALAIRALSAEVAAADPSKSGSEAERREAKAALEAATLGAVETAELSKKPVHLEQGYELYLEFSPERAKAVEVQYQKAHLLYEKGDYAVAAEALRAVASSEAAGPVEVKARAADLALDSLVLAKSDALIETWAREFAAKFPAKRDEFLKLARTSVLNQAASATLPVASAAVSDDSLRQAWTILARYPVEEATPREQAVYWKNRLVLAEKLGKHGDAREAAENVLKSPQTADADREYALSRKAWLAELALDFDGALAATEKMAPSAFPNREQKWLKLALYADLATKDSRPFYEKFLSESKDAAGRRLIAARLVRESAQPEAELERRKAALQGDAEAYARLALEAYARTGRVDSLRKAVKDLAVEKTMSGKVIGRVLLFAELAPLKAKLEGAKIDASNQRKLAASLKARLGLVEQLEKLAGRAVALQDWAAQLVTLDRLARESERFYQEILALPVPAGLSGDEEMQYLALLSQQASPHQVRAQDMTKKVAEFWANEAAIPQLRASFAAEKGAFRRMLAEELDWIALAAPEDKRAAVQAIAALPETVDEKPGREALEAARRSVRENPMNRESLAKLLELERRSGRETMASYLETRLSTLDESGAAGAAPAGEVKR